MLFNKLVRLRDSKDGYFRCISCGENKSIDQMNAGHYYSVKQFDGLRYDEDNCHGQCVHCNKWLDGNLIEYSEKLPDKIGQEAFEKLKIRAGAQKRQSHKWHRFELELFIQEFKRRLKLYEKE